MELTDFFGTFFQIQTRINDFIKDSTKEKNKFEPMDKVFRAIV